MTLRFLTIWLALSAIVMAQSSNIRTITEISGKSLKIIQIAIPEAAKHNVDWERRKIVVMESDSTFLVLFDDPDRAAGQRGSTSNFSTYEVEIKKDGYQIVRSNYSR